MNMAKRIAAVAALAVASTLPSAAMADDDVPWVYDATARVAEVSSSETGVATGGIETFGTECSDSNGLGRFRSISGATRIVVR